MATDASPFDTAAGPDTRHPIIRYNPEEPSELEMVEAAWGSNPRFSDGVTYRFVRSEGRGLASHRCLIPASEFRMSVGDRRYRVTLVSGDHFYLAGTWEPAISGWPLAFRIITVAANREVAEHQERHGAIILRHQVKAWLNARLPEVDILETPPARTFAIEEIGATLKQQIFAL